MERKRYYYTRYYYVSRKYEMSYCVNCGVELHEGAPKCPLCDTPVLNPNVARDENKTPSAYPDNAVLPVANGRRYVAFIASIILLIPNVICFAINMLDYTTYGTWFLYVTLSSIAVWIICILPLLPSKANAYVFLIIDYFILLLYFILIFSISFRDKTVGATIFVKFVFPHCTADLAILLFLFAFFKKKRQTLEKAIALTSCIAVTGGLTFWLVIYTFFPTSKLVLPVEICIATSAVALDVFFISVLKNKRLKAWISKKFFI